MKVIGENEVRIQLKSSTGPMGPAGADGKDGTSVTHSWRGTTLTVTSASGTSSADLKGEKGEPGKDGKDGATGLVGPAGADGKDGQDGVSPTVTVEAIDGGHRVTITDANRMQSFDVMDGVDGKDGAGGSGSSVELDTTLTQSGKAADAKVVGDKLSELNEANATQNTEIAKKANDADLAKVAKSGSYNDLSDKPTIPTVPTTLPNPNKLILTGAVTAEYDGSTEVSVEIPAGGGSSEWRLIKTVTVPATAEEGAEGVYWADMPSGGVNFAFDTDDEGNPFSLTQLAITAKVGFAGDSGYFSLNTDTNVPGYRNGVYAFGMSVFPKDSTANQSTYLLEVAKGKYFSISVSVSGGYYAAAQMSARVESFNLPITKISCGMMYKPNNGFYQGSTFEFYGR